MTLHPHTLVDLADTRPHIWGVCPQCCLRVKVYVSGHDLAEAEAIATKALNEHILAAHDRKEEPKKTG
jgi:hypothetical protein